MESMVVVDCWQNQRYRPMQGTWLKPFDGGVAFYTDITGNFGIPYSNNEVDSLMSVDLEYSITAWASSMIRPESQKGLCMKL